VPFTRISLQAGKPPDYLAALSRGLHDAMTESFDVPAGDMFHVIHQHRPEEMAIDPTYLGGPRSEHFVLFHITVGRVRSAAAKQAFYRRLVERLSDSPGIRPEDVMIVISTSAGEDWSFGSGLPADVAAGTG
jgi:phenylpyruvate tautomerase PptA (4-oxalocrotonate tautomerase family)